jgi:hypothetical protein
VKSNAESEAGTPPSPALMAAVGELTMEMMKAGVVVDTGGLMPSSSGAKIRIGAGGLKVVDGPFSEAKEVIGGYAILRADSREEAIELGRRFMQVHQDVLGPTYEGELEIRQLTEFGPPR